MSEPDEQAAGFRLVELATAAGLLRVRGPLTAFSGLDAAAAAIAAGPCEITLNGVRVGAEAAARVLDSQAEAMLAGLPRPDPPGGRAARQPPVLVSEQVTPAGLTRTAEAGSLRVRSTYQAVWTGDRVDAPDGYVLTLAETWLDGVPVTGRKAGALHAAAGLVPDRQLPGRG